MLCNLQIFSGCACHLEQLHAQSPFVFPIVFGINLMPFFSILAEDSLSFVLVCASWAAAHSQLSMLKEKFGLFVDFEFLMAMGSWSTD